MYWGNTGSFWPTSGRVVLVVRNAVCVSGGTREEPCCLLTVTPGALHKKHTEAGADLSTAQTFHVFSEPKPQAKGELLTD